MIPFEKQSMSYQESWLQKARDHLDKAEISFGEKDRNAVVYLTAIWLYQLSDFTMNRMEYPCYVVHCVEEKWRFVTDSYKLALGRFKNAQKRGGALCNRAAVFYWSAPGKCDMRHSSEGYPFSTDYLPV